MRVRSPYECHTWICRLTLYHMSYALFSTGWMDNILMLRPVQLPREPVTWELWNSRFYVPSRAHRKPITSRRPWSSDLNISGSVILLLNRYWPQIGAIYFFFEKVSKLYLIKKVNRYDSKKQVFQGERTNLTLHSSQNKTLRYFHVSKLRKFELPGGQVLFNCNPLRRFHTRNHCRCYNWNGLALTGFISEISQVWRHGALQTLETWDFRISFSIRTADSDRFAYIPYLRISETSFYASCWSRKLLFIDSNGLRTYTGIDV